MSLTEPPVDRAPSIAPVTPITPVKPIKHGPPLPLFLTISRAQDLAPVGSPCTTVCRLDEATRTYCRGCHRSREEIKAWKTLPDDARLAILAVLLTREAQRHAG